MAHVHGKLDMDPVSLAAVETVEMEQQHEEIAELDEKYREKLIAQVHQIIGRIQGVKLISQTGDVASLVWIKQVKDSKIYKDVPGLGSWEKFCDRLGLSRRKIDEDLQNLENFGQDFLATVASFKVGYRELRKLRYAAADGDLLIEAEGVTVGEEKIPLDPDHVEDLEAAIETLLESRDKTITEQGLTLKAKDRIMKEKERVIIKQERDLARHEREIKARGFAPGEEEFLKQLEAIKLQFTGMSARIEPDAIDLIDATPHMMAAYLETVGYIRRLATALHDTAIEHYGTPEMDNGWTPPKGSASYDDDFKLDIGDIGDKG